MAIRRQQRGRHLPKALNCRPSPTPASVRTKIHKRFYVGKGYSGAQARARATWHKLD